MFAPAVNEFAVLNLARRSDADKKMRNYARLFVGDTAESEIQHGDICVDPDWNHVFIVVDNGKFVDFRNCKTLGHIYVSESVTQRFSDTLAHYELLVNDNDMKGYVFHFVLQPSDRSIERLFGFRALPQWKAVYVCVCGVARTPELSAIDFGQGYMWRAILFDDDMHRRPTADFNLGDHVLNTYWTTCDTAFFVIAAFILRTKSWRDRVVPQHYAILERLVEPPPEWRISTVIDGERRLVAIRFSGAYERFDEKALRKCAADVCKRAELTQAGLVCRLVRFLVPDPRLPRVAYSGHYTNDAFRSFAAPSWSYTSRQWRSTHQRLLDLVLALLPLQAPSNSLLEIIDWLDDYVHARRCRKVWLIESVYRSARRLIDLRQASPASVTQTRAGKRYIKG